MNPNHSTQIKRQNIKFCTICITLLVFTLLSGQTTRAFSYAINSSLYVDGAAGVDDPACGTSTEPCKTIQYTLDQRAAGGDTLQIAQGTYLENPIVQTQVTLKGGFNADTWEYDPSQYETIIDGSSAPPLEGDWDGRYVYKPSVLFNGSVYTMWYDGTDLQHEVRIGVATSSDGINWTRYVDNPVLDNDGQPWNDPNSEHDPYVLEVPGGYAMYFEAQNDGTRELYRALSSDGLDWTVNPQAPILSPTPGTYDEDAAAHGTVILDDGLYRLWYHAMGNLGPVIAYAESSDGVTNWTNKALVLAGTSPNWYEFGVWGPSVIKDEVSDLWLFYAGVGPAHGPSIGLMKSTDDGASWVPIGDVPIITGEGNWGDPHVIYEGAGVFKLWFNNFENGSLYYSTNSGGSWAAPQQVLTPGTLGYLGSPVIQLYNSSNNTTLDSLTITGGNGIEAGGVITGDMYTIIKRCYIHHNTADGSPNSWGGGGVLSAGVLEIYDSIITQNTVTQGAGGVRIGGGSLTVNNCLIADNYGDAGIHTNGSTDILFSTIANNAQGTGQPGIIFSTDSTELHVYNSIIYGNGGGPVYGPVPENIYFNYSLLEGGWTGPGNLDADPLFVDPAGGNFRLQLRSPAVDAGLNDNVPPFDLDGIARPQDGDLDGIATADMGAYEFFPYPIFLPLIVK